MLILKIVILVFLVLVVLPMSYCYYIGALDEVLYEEHEWSYKLGYLWGVLSIAPKLLLIRIIVFLTKGR